MKHNRSIFATRMIEARKAKGMSQMRFAIEIDVHQQTVSFWEVDRCQPRMDMLPKIARALGVSLDWLLGMDAEV